LGRGAQPARRAGFGRGTEIVRPAD